MGVQQRAKAADKDHGALAGRCTGAGTVLAQHPPAGVQDNEVSAQANLRSRLRGIAAAAAKSAARRLEPPDRAPGDKRRRLGTESTHWRTGRRRITWSARCAAVSTMRQVVQDGQTPLHLQV